MFNEDNTVEQMILTRLQQNWWHYVPAEELPRKQNEVLVESMVKSALIRLNPEIAEDPSRADQVIYKLRSPILFGQPHFFCVPSHYHTTTLLAKNLLSYYLWLTLKNILLQE